MENQNTNFEALVKEQEEFNKKIVAAESLHDLIEAVGAAEVNCIIKNLDVWGCDNCGDFDNSGSVYANVDDYVAMVADCYAHEIDDVDEYLDEARKSFCTLAESFDSYIFDAVQYCLRNTLSDECENEIKQAKQLGDDK